MRWQAIAAVAMLAAGGACADIKSQTYSYGTLDEARRAGAIEQGWLPDGLPPGTREIRVAYIPGGTERWGLFNFPPGEREHLERLLAPGEIDFEGLRVGIPARIEWWPVALRGALDGERLGFTGLQGYRTADGAFVVAVNWNQGRAYYWKAGG
jgi:hypothetical protein